VIKSFRNICRHKTFKPNPDKDCVYQPQSRIGQILMALATRRFSDNIKLD